MFMCYKILLLLLQLLILMQKNYAGRNKCPKSVRLRYVAERASIPTWIIDNF
jgi:hypothetical protein